MTPRTRAKMQGELGICADGAPHQCLLPVLWSLLSRAHERSSPREWQVGLVAAYCAAAHMT